MKNSVPATYEEYIAAFKQQVTIMPNFWVSEMYFRHAGWKVVKNDTHVWVIDEDEVVMLKPLLYQENDRKQTFGRVPASGAYRVIDYIWALHIGDNAAPGYMWVEPHMKKLDEQFIFDSKDFLTMEGGKWAVFRKNVRKFPNRYEKPLCVRNFPAGTGKDRIQARTEVLVSWLESVDPTEEVYDSDVLLSYATDPQAACQEILDSDGRLLSVSYWDENHIFTNYRYCFCLPLPYLSEYARYQFHVWHAGHSDSPVNDGGSLGDPKLYAFKSKMNPRTVLDIYTFNKEPK